jgi:hypothetical protein
LTGLVDAEPVLLLPVAVADAAPVSSMLAATPRPSYSGCCYARAKLLWRLRIAPVTPSRGSEMQASASRFRQRSASLAAAILAGVASSALSFAQKAREPEIELP